MSTQHLTEEQRAPAARSRDERRRGGPRHGLVGSVLLVLAITFGFVGAGAGAANAATVRPGAKAFQVDVLLDGYETEAARRSFWAATVICWNSGVTGKLLALGPCQGMVSVCAAQAYYAGKWAGITFAPGTAWCWKY